MAAPAGNILVMDVDAEGRERTCATLARAFHRCLGVATSTDAVLATRSGAVDVALIDSGEDASSDVRLAQRLRGEVGDLAVVVLAREPNLDAALDAMRAGVFDYLLKPCSAEDIVASVDRALQWRLAAVRQRSGTELAEEELTDRVNVMRAAIEHAAIDSTESLEQLIDRFYSANRATLEHLRRVASYAAGLGSAVGLSPAALADVARAGLLHEIGKLLLPDRITAKWTPLTTHEHALFRTHIERGADMIRSVPLLRGAAAIVVATRERYDGTGYPRGLAGASIPIGGGIVAIADLFDSHVGMTLSADPLSLDSANAELVRAAGTWFDPALVAAWLRYSETSLAPLAPRPARRGPA